MKRVRILPALFFALLLGLLSFGITKYIFDHQKSGGVGFNFLKQEDPKELALAVVQEIKAGNYQSIFENTQKEYPSFDSKEAYEQALHNLYQEIDPSSLTIDVIENNDQVSRYQIHDKDQYLGTLKIVKQEEGNLVSLPIQGSETYIFEVPTGKKFSMNGIEVDHSYLMEENVPASNFFQFSNQTSVPHVDIYEVDHLLGLPEVEVDGQENYEIIEDSITGHLLVGETLNDFELEEIMIMDAQKIAQYPAQEVGLGAVSEIAVTDSTWYQKYTTLQNYWFTSHNISNFSNQEVLKSVKQSEDTAVGHVVFDYYADNGEVHRTWYIGYQLTMVNTPQGWKVGGIEINNELNPRQIVPE